jgi:hypothetical protein
LPPPQGSPRAAANGGEAAAARDGGAQQAPQTLTLAGLGQGPRAPPFFTLMGFFQKFSHEVNLLLINYLININSFNKY